MKIKKVNLDRKPLDTAYVQQKQDFQQLMSMYRKATNPVWKQPLFYGVIGFASVAAVVVSSLIDFNSEPIQNTTTLTQKEETIKSSVNTSLNNEAVKMVNPKESSVADEPRISASTVERRTATEVKKTTESEELKAAFSEKKIDEPVVSVTKPSAMIPTISGQSQGTLKASQLCSLTGIEMGQEIKISSFHILYSVGLREKMVSVKGEKIPEEVCKDLELSGYEQMVFITDIKGVKEGEVIHLPSLNFWVIRG
jgi:hypothetical protein